MKAGKTPKVNRGEKTREDPDKTKETRTAPQTTVDAYAAEAAPAAAAPSRIATVPTPQITGKTQDVRLASKDYRGKPRKGMPEAKHAGTSATMQALQSMAQQALSSTHRKILNLLTGNGLKEHDLQYFTLFQLSEAEQVQVLKSQFCSKNSQPKSTPAVVQELAKNIKELAQQIWLSINQIPLAENPFYNVVGVGTKDKETNIRKYFLRHEMHYVWAQIFMQPLRFSLIPPEKWMVTASHSRWDQVDSQEQKATPSLRILIKLIFIAEKAKISVILNHLQKIDHQGVIFNGGTYCAGKTSSIKQMEQQIRQKMVDKGIDVNTPMIVLAADVVKNILSNSKLPLAQVHVMGSQIVHMLKSWLNKNKHPYIYDGSLGNTEYIRDAMRDGQGKITVVMHVINEVQQKLRMAARPIGGEDPNISSGLAHKSYGDTLRTTMRLRFIMRYINEQKSKFSGAASVEQRAAISIDERLAIALQAYIQHPDSKLDDKVDWVDFSETLKQALQYKGEFKVEIRGTKYLRQDDVAYKIDENSTTNEVWDDALWHEKSREYHAISQVLLDEPSISIGDMLTKYKGRFISEAEGAKIIEKLQKQDVNLEKPIDEVLDKKSLGLR